MNNKEFAIGNVADGDIGQKDFLKKVTIDNFKKCAHCWARNLCVAGCPHENLASTGDMNLPHDSYCRYVKKIKSELIRLYLRLSDEDIEILFKKK